MYYRASTPEDTDSPGGVAILTREETTMRKPVSISGPDVPDSTGEVVGMEEGVLRVRCERRIPDSASATVAFDRIQLSGRVLGSEPMGNDWGISIALNFSRRREARLPASGQVTVGVVSIRGTTSYEATLVDVSPSGFSVRMPTPVSLGTRLYIETATEIIIGEVRHSRPTADGEYILGAMVTEVVKDSRMQGQFAAFWGSVRRRMGAGGVRGTEAQKPSAAPASSKRKDRSE